MRGCTLALWTTYPPFFLILCLAPAGPSLPSRPLECYYLGAFNRKGGARGRFREIGVSSARRDFKCFKREKIGNLTRHDDESTGSSFSLSLFLSFDYLTLPTKKQRDTLT